jgi:hypothetical protein
VILALLLLSAAAGAAMFSHPVFFSKKNPRPDFF